MDTESSSSTSSHHQEASVLKSKLGAEFKNGNSAADGMHHSNSNHHVKFDLVEEEVKTHHDHLEIKEIDRNNFKINLGFLKIDHYYTVTFDIKHDYNELTLLNNESSRHVSLKEVRRNNETGTLTFTFVFYAFKEKLDEEQVFFGVKTGNNQNESLKFEFEARVLGAHQGTPLLRNGVTLLHKKGAHPTSVHSHD